MKTSLDIPEKELRETLAFSKAPTKREAVLTALRYYNKRHRMEALVKRIRGTFKDFMTQDDLKLMREDEKWEKLK